MSSDELTAKNFSIRKKNKYLIHAYTGRFFSSQGRKTGIILFEYIVKAFSNTEFDVVISLGTEQKLPPDLKTGENISICEWVPVDEVIPKCDLVIHHGGHGYSLPINRIRRRRR